MPLHPAAHAIGKVGIGPGHHKTVWSQCRDCRILLLAIGDRVDQKFAAEPDPVCAEDLSLDCTDAGIATHPAGIGPHYDEIAVGERSNRGLRLPACCRSIDEEFTSDLPAGGIEYLRLDAVTAGVATQTAEIQPSHDEIAVGERRHERSRLQARRLAIDEEFAAELRAIGVEDLGSHCVRIAPRTAVVRPGHYKAADGRSCHQPCNGRLLL